MLLPDKQIRLNLIVFPFQNYSFSVVSNRPLIFAYCLNNPVNMADDDGTVAWWIAAAVTGAAWDAAFYCVEAAITGNFSWKGLGKAALKGAVTGLAFGAVGKIAGKAVKAVKTAKSAKRAAKAVKYTTGTPNKVGQIGEKLAKIVKNNTKYKINGRWRIPDGTTSKFVQEVKNVKSLSLTSQLKDSIQLASSMGKRLQLFIRPNTYLSGPLRQAIRRYNVKITYLW